jgi:hypothetical protein
MGNGSASFEGIWQGIEADHSPSSSAEVKNQWNYTSIPTCFYLQRASEKLYPKFECKLTRLYEERKRVIS